MNRPPGAKSKQIRALFLGGILPVIIFAVIEDRCGTMWGLVAGMIFGVGEIFWEWRTLKKVDTVTWAGNGMMISLGIVSLVTQDGIWFKLQPALIEMGMTVFLWGSVWMKKPLLLTLMQKQGGFAAQPGVRLRESSESGLQPGLLEVLTPLLSGVTFRIGLFFAVHGVIAIWAALYWSTAAWAMLKGVGLTVSLIAYMVLESLVMRRRLSTRR